MTCAGSGKTHTLIGDVKGTGPLKGLLSRAVDELAQGIATLQSQCQFRVICFSCVRVSAVRMPSYGCHDGPQGLLIIIGYHQEVWESMHSVRNMLVRLRPCPSLTSASS